MGQFENTLAKMRRSTISTLHVITRFCIKCNQIVPVQDGVVKKTGKKTLFTCKDCKNENSA